MMELIFPIPHSSNAARMRPQTIQTLMEAPHQRTIVSGTFSTPTDAPETLPANAGRYAAAQPTKAELQRRSQAAKGPCRSTPQMAGHAQAKAFALLRRSAQIGMMMMETDAATIQLTMAALDLRIMTNPAAFA